MKRIFHHTYDDIISLDNLLLAYQEFLSGKRDKKDVQEFSLHLMDNIIALHTDLKNLTYQHGTYEDFFVNDPKRRHIHKATVRDRLLYHAIYRILYPFFDKTFISDSFSCRRDKGTHKALDRFRSLANKVSKNHTRTCWVLKCDIKQFFASIDRQILANILKEYISDKDILSLLNNVIGSFSSNCHAEFISASPEILKRVQDDKMLDFRLRGNDNGRCRGLPLGNLTSQLFANLYLNELDQFVKHQLKIKHYLRYADDFAFFSTNKEHLQTLLPSIQSFLYHQLNLTLHPNKIILKTLSSGVDFLGWTHFSHHRTLRTKTKKRMFKRIMDNPKEEVLQSYLGLLGHGDTYEIRQNLVKAHWLMGKKSV